MLFRRQRKPQKELLETPATPIQWIRMLKYLRPYLFRLFFALLSVTASAILGLVFPWVIQNVVDVVLQEKNETLLNNITLALLFVFLLRSFTSLIEVYLLNWIGERVVIDLRNDLYQHLINLPLGFFVERRVGELISRISSDVTVMRNLLTSNISTLLQQTLTLIGAIIIMFVLNARLTLFILALVPLIVIIGFAFGYYMRRISTQVQDELAGATVVAEEVLQNIREVKSFVREPYEKQRYNTAIERSFQAAIRLVRVRAVFGPTVAFLGFGAISMILWFGGREVIAGDLTGGELIAFLIYGLTVAGSFAALVGLYSSLQEAIGATKRVFQILDTQSSIIDKPDAQTIDHVRGEIQLNQVSFHYLESIPVLDHIDLHIQAGEVLALVGPSGAGKSTLFNLIPRFYDVTSGSVQIDGHDLRDLKKASIRDHIAIVPQETLLFGGTIRENILYGKLDATEEELIAAATAANAHNFILELSDQYETIVGERGTKLSGGKRQRIAIARALLKDPQILLLDEATSSLDNESEQLVQEALARLMHNRTTIIIAHRLSTVNIANRIAVLDKGQITELGNHEQLMQLNGLYARLYEMQFHDAATPEIISEALT
ncbi:ABC transporter ATP-binding protein [Anaerolineales bacterium]